MIIMMIMTCAYIAFIHTHDGNDDDVNGNLFDGHIYNQEAGVRLAIETSERINLHLFPPLVTLVELSLSGMEAFLMAIFTARMSTKSQWNSLARCLVLIGS
jgi:hypothetical protein